MHKYLIESSVCFFLDLIMVITIHNQNKFQIHIKLFLFKLKFQMKTL